MMPLANTLHRRLRDELEAIRCLSAQPQAAGGGCSEDGWHPKWSAWALLRLAWLAGWLAGWGWFDTSKNLNKVSGNAAKRKSSQAKPRRAKPSSISPTRQARQLLLLLQIPLLLQLLLLSCTRRAAHRARLSVTQPRTRPGRGIQAARWNKSLSSGPTTPLN